MNKYLHTKSRLKYLLLLILLIVFIIAVYFLTLKKSSADIVENKRISDLKNISPGGNRAILTLDNGASMIIDSENMGPIAHQGNSTIIKSANDCLTYSLENTSPSEIAYNTLTTPQGGRYRLVLPDGTKIWLNDSSSITFPSAFTGTQRLVMISGEVYFEVVSNANKPFVVKTRDQVVENLGTAFDINGYPENHVITTTPVRGTVKVFFDTTTILLNPGQQVLFYGPSFIKKDNVAVENEIAWHEGLFIFDGNSLAEIMDQIGRWYDLKIKIEGPVSPKKFKGSISSQLNLYEVLHVLEKDGIQLKVEGKELHVYQANTMYWCEHLNLLHNSQ